MTDTLHQQAARELAAATLKISRRYAADTAAAHTFRDDTMTAQAQHDRRQQLLADALQRRMAAEQLARQASQAARAASERYVAGHPLPQPTDAELAAARARIDRERNGGRTFGQILATADPAMLAALPLEAPSILRAEQGPAQAGQEPIDPARYLAQIAARRAELAGGQVAAAHAAHAEVTRLTDAADARLSTPTTGLGYDHGSELYSAVAARMIRGGQTRSADDSGDTGEAA